MAYAAELAEERVLLPFFRADSDAGLILLSGAAVLLFLTSWLNAGLLLLARSARQARDTGIRAALGASTRDLLRQVVAEGGVVGVAGVAFGIFLAWVALPIILTVVPPDLPRADEIVINTTVLAFAVVAGLVSVVGVGLLAHYGVARKPSIGNAGSTVTVSRPALIRRRALLVLQTAATVVLVTSAGLLLRSFWRLSHVDLGFSSSNLMTFQTRVLEGHLAREEFQMRAEHPDDHTERGVHQIAFDLRSELHQRMRRIPGISDVAISTTLPFWDFDESTWVPQSRTAEVSRTRVPANQRTVSPEFFDLLGIRLLAGRLLSDSDTKNAPPVAVVSSSLAAALFPSGSAVGQKLHWGNAYDIVGIVEDVRWRRPEDEPRPAFYLPAAQHTPTVIAVIARTSLDMHAFSEAARAVLGSGEPCSGLRTGLMLPPDLANASYRLGAALGTLAALSVTRFLASSLFEVRPTDPMTIAIVVGGLALVALVCCLGPARRATRVDPLIALRAE